MPKHLLLYQAFGWEPPVFAHLPLLLNPDRSKLSKRQGHVAVEEFQTDGYLPMALVNFVALLGWHEQSNQEVYDLEGLKQAFDLQRVQKGGAIFDTEKLIWLNGQHLRRLEPDAFRSAITPHLDPGWDVTPAMSAAIQEKINMLPEVREQLAFFFEDPVIFDDAAREALQTAPAKDILTALMERLVDSADFDGEWFLSTVKSLGADFSLKGRDLWHPIRAAIAGRVVGPDMITIVETFGLEKCQKRVAAALKLT
jgi:glutamyl/glutaminyl-tRNA synthetase